MSITITKINYGHYEDIINPGWYSGPNAAGGVDLQVDFKNSDSSRTIKYAVFTVTAYNAVGDEAPNELDGLATKRLKFTGPLAPGANKTGTYWECSWYNHSIKTLKIDKVEIEYMDGSTETQTTGLTPQRATSSSGGTSGGCYVATAVYGSYDCPEVWTLRRYRDNQLSKTWKGRLFIHTYYTFSPMLVKWFGNTPWFKNMWKPALDKMVKELRESGVEDTPYDDIEW